MAKSLVINSFAVGSAVLASGLMALPAEAFSFSFDDNFTGGDPATITVNLQDQGAGSVKFTVGTNDGDLSAFFFDFADTSVLGTLSVSGPDVTSSDFSGGVTSVGSNSNNINGGGPANNGPYDAGIGFLRPGSSGGLLQSTMFTITDSSGALDLNQFTSQNFAARLQTTSGSAGSSKLQGTSPAQIPTPALLPGLIGMGAAALRKRQQEAEVEVEI